MGRRIASPLTGFALLAVAAAVPATALAESHELVTRVDGARVQMQIPADARIGSTSQMAIRVIPEPGVQTPRQVRTRLGMPHHGHWISDEAATTDVAEPVVHTSELPMGGVYRLRVWLDYPDGRTVRTGADFKVDDSRTHAPTPAP